MNRIHKYIFLLAAILIFASNPKAIFCQIYNPTNLNFEFPVLRQDSIPTAWNISEKSMSRGYKAKVSTDAYSGKYSLMIYNDSAKYLQGAGGLIDQEISPNAYLGKRIKLSAFCKSVLSDKASKAVLWIKVYDDQRTFSELTCDLPNQNDWKQYSVEAEIPTNAVKIEYGLMLNGAGKIWIDDVEFGLSGESKYSSIELNKSQVNELRDYAKFISPFFFYYPDARLAKADLRSLTEYGVDRLLADNGKFEDKIIKAFPFANQLAVNSRSKEIIKSFDKMQFSDTSFPAFRLHQGVHSLQSKSLYSSRLQSWIRNFRDFPALIIHRMVVADNANKPFEFKVFMKHQLIGKHSKAYAAITFIDAGKQIISIVLPEEKKNVKQGEWIELSYSGTIPEESITADISLFLDGEGRAIFDDVSFMANGQEIVKNGSFEQFTKNWSFDEKSEIEGYVCAKNIADKRTGNASLELKVANDKYLNYPQAGEFSIAHINPKLYFSFPKVAIVNLQDTSQLVPLDTKAYQLFNNASARIAAVIYTWAFLENFSQIKAPDYTSKLDNALSTAIKDVANSQNKDELIRAIQQVAALFPDNAIRFWYNEQLSMKNKTLPIAYKYIDNNLYVYRSSREDIPTGSKILKINGVSTNEYFQNERKYISAASIDFKNTKIASQLANNYYDRNDTFLIEIGNKTKEIILSNSEANQYALSNIFPADTNLGDGIFYFDMTWHNDGSISRIFKENHTSMKGIIFDLRGYTKISEYFFKFFKNGNFDNIEWKLPYFTEFGKQPEVFRNFIQAIEGKGLLANAKIIVLCDEKSIGLSEGHLHLLRRNNLAQFVGSPSSGGATEPTVIPLPCELSMSMSGISASDKNGNLLIGKAFEPDILVKISQEDIKSNKDSVILHSIELMRKLIK